MWIRSQDKLSLVNATEIFAMKFPKNFAITAISASGNETILGRYAHEETTIAILDDLQAEIEYNPESQFHVFELPKEG